MAEDLTSTLPEVVRAGLELGTAELQVRCRDHLAKLPPDSPKLDAAESGSECIIEEVNSESVTIP